MLLNLMRSELSRLRYRRRVWGSLIIMIVVGVFAPSTWADQIPAPTDAELTLFEADLVRMRLTGECPECTIDDLFAHLSFGQMIHDAFPLVTLFLAFLTFMIVITYVAADFTSGALATQLTFTPRRGVLLAARTLAGGVLGTALMAAGLVATSASAVVIYLSVNGIDSIGPAPGLLDLLLISLLYGFLLGAIATLVSFILRNTALSMAAAVTVLVVNGLLEGASYPTQVFWLHLMPLRTGVALLVGEATSYVMTPTGSRLITVTRAEGIVFHLVVIVLLGALAAFLFQRRDVKG